MSYLDAKTVYQITDRIITFLNENLIYPYEQASSKLRGNDFVKGQNFALTGNFPKIQVIPVNFQPDHITQQKSGYLDINYIDFIIYYYNQNAHRFTFQDTGLTLINEAQNFEYLQYVKKTLKDNVTDFDEYIHRFRFGSISKPTFNKNNNVWMGMLPFSGLTTER